MLFKKDLLEIIPYLKEIAKDSKSLHNNLKIIMMEKDCCSIPIINDIAISAYENFVNKYILKNGAMNYRNLKNFCVENVTIFSDADSSEEAIAIYFCNIEYTGNVAFVITITVDGKLKLILDTPDETAIDDIASFIKEEITKVRM